MSFADKTFHWQFADNSLDDDDDDDDDDET